jgi:hypothetical protein
MDQVSEAWHNFQPRYSNIIDNPIAGEVPGRFTTRDGRSGQFLSRLEMGGQAVNECQWVADDGSETGGWIEVWKRFDADPLNPKKELVQYSNVGDRGFEISKQKSNNGEKTSIRPFRMTQGPTVTADIFQKATLIGIPVKLHPQQDTMTYDPTRGGTRGRNTRAPTVAFTQEGITGKVAKTNFGFKSYDVGEGDQERSVAWDHYTVNNEPLTQIRTHYFHGETREIELPRGSRPELDAIDGGPNFTGRFLVSVDPVNADMA